MDKRIINAWCLYDFGNSAFAVLFPFVYGTYYEKAVVGGASGPAWWGYTVSLSMLLVALSGPLLGGVADHSGRRKRMLALYTALGVAACLGFLGVRPGYVVTGFLIGAIANFAFEGGIVFYNAYLPDIAPATHHGRISARGFAVGYVGSLVAIGIAALCAPRLEWIWGALAAQWLLFAVPALRRLPPDRPTGLGVGRAAIEGVRQTAATFRDILGRRNLRRFLLAYFFYMDGVNTVILFAGVYASKEFGFSTGELLVLVALVQVTALLGSVVTAVPTDRKGPRRTVRTVLLWWMLVVVVAYFVENRLHFWFVAVLAGLGVGSIQASSRAFMSRLIPDGREAEFFGFYALCGKTGAVLGPLVFGQIAQAFEGDMRPAILSVVALFLLGYLVLRGVKAEANEADEPSSPSSAT